MPAQPHTYIGKYPFYGHDMGIVLLDIKIPRPSGDIGNARSFAYPVDYEVAAGATGKDMHTDPNERVMRSVLDAAQRLVARGVKALATSCGLLAVYHDKVVAELGVPMVTSSLLQIPLALRVISPGKKIGVVTVDSKALTPAHFTGVGVSDQDMRRVVIAGMEHTDAFFPAITRNGQELDVDRARQDVLDVTAQLLEREPDIGGLVLECTNLCVYSDALREAFGLPVWDAVGLVDWLTASVSS
ncbi:aspartate/glutamate racemase family protein [Dactylosporangium sp. NPDC051484]|uniref:aspartate/glutamate racemase family protein n=1 Tax=Dactylosporangium sp. NPDC051484 TaxID=3154942 RepID=UPI003450B866